MLSDFSHDLSRGFCWPQTSARRGRASPRREFPGRMPGVGPSQYGPGLGQRLWETCPRLGVPVFGGYTDRAYGIRPTPEGLGSLPASAVSIEIHAMRHTHTVISFNTGRTRALRWEIGHKPTEIRLGTGLTSETGGKRRIAF